MLEWFSGFATVLGTSTSCVTVIVQTGANFGRVSLDRETAGHHFLWLAKETMQPCKHMCIVQGPKDKSDKIKQNRFSLQRIKALHPLSLWNITSDDAGDWPYQKEPQSHAPTTKVPG
jgi:hypothetical protein